eukprot:9888690-Alexandrium_andersonii.AAC.1
MPRRRYAAARPTGLHDSTRWSGQHSTRRVLRVVGLARSRSQPVARQRPPLSRYANAPHARGAARRCS